MTVRIHKLAKEIGLSSKELIDKLHKLKIKVKGHMSSIDDKTAFLIKEEISGKKEKRKVPSSDTKKKSQVVTVPPKEAQEPAKDLKILKVNLPITIKDLSIKLQLKPSELIKRLLNKKILVTINQTLNDELAQNISEEFGYMLERLPTEEESLLSEHDQEDVKDLKPRAPIVTFMGHVDHGKTSLMDMIRKTKVVDKEAGGITQHIGAYEVVLSHGKVTFLDTPGHAAFTAMRARGANITDVVVLVVAADDGIMPQTIEAIDHARAANVPIVVAINKIDKQNVDIDRVKKQLSKHDLLAEDWGGKAITVGVSGKTGEGIDKLLEMLVLEAEMLELKANPDRPAKGIVVEAELSKGKGPVATVLVSNGTLKVGNVIIAGVNYGKVKAMLDDRGHRVDQAPPAKPVEILGLSGVPLVGEKFYVVSDEKKAKDIVSTKRLDLEKKKLEAKGQKITLEGLYDKIKEGEVKELKIILKADVQGSLEALKDSLEKLSTDEVKLSVIHAQVGNINESDVILASASNAVILGFHVDVMPNAKSLSKQEGVDVRNYNIIYEAVNDIKAAMEGMLEPILEETFLGRAEVRQVFKVSKAGIVAGSFVLKGTIPRNTICKILRNKELIFKGKTTSLKHFKDDIKEAKEGFECGISFGFKDIKKGDIIEAVEIRKVARRLK